MPSQPASLNPSSLKLENFLTFKLSLTSNAVASLISHSYSARFGLNIVEWHIITKLAEGPSLTQQELCDQISIDKVTISRTIQTLMNRGLAQRTPNLNDRRSHLLTLKKEGQQLFKEVVPAAIAFDTIIFQTLNEKERKDFTHYLERISERVNEISKNEYSP